GAGGAAGAAIEGVGVAAHLVAAAIESAHLAAAAAGPLVLARIVRSAVDRAARGAVLDDGARGAAGAAIEGVGVAVHLVAAAIEAAHLAAAAAAAARASGAEAVVANRGEAHAVVRDVDGAAADRHVARELVG